MSGTFVGMPAFPIAAREALADTQLRRNLAHATRTIRDKRAAVVAEVEDWEELRVAGAAVKEAALRDLATHLETLEASLDPRRRDRPLGARRRGGVRDRRLGRAHPRRGRGGQGQVDGDRRDRPQRGAGGRGDRRLGDRPGRAHRPARRRPPLAHPGARHPPQPGRGPRDLPPPDGRRRASGARRPHRRAGHAGGGGAPAPAREVPPREGRRERRQLRRRRHRHARRRGVRGQRPDVPDPARGAGERRRHREGRRHLVRPRPDAAAAAALVDGGADEPLHLDLVGRDARRRPAGGARRAARQRPHPRARRRRRSAGAALHPLLGLPQRVPGLRARRRPRLRLGLPRPDRRHPQPAPQRRLRRADRVPAVRLVALRCLLRGLPGPHRHPVGARRPTRGRRRLPSRRPRPQARSSRDEGRRLDVLRLAPAAVGRARLRGGRPRPRPLLPYDAARRPHRRGPPARARRRLDRSARPARPADGVLPRVVGPHGRWTPSPTTSSEGRS